MGTHALGLIRALVKLDLSRGKEMGRSTSTSVNRALQRPFVGSGRGCLLMAGALTFRGTREGQSRRKIETKFKYSITRIPLESLGFISYIASTRCSLFYRLTLTTFISVFLTIYPPTRSLEFLVFF